MIGMAGELSEAIELSGDAITSKVSYEALVSEIGDIVWYLLFITMQSKNSIKKLAVRV